MMSLKYSDFSSLLKPLGRTWTDGERYHFNWTCSGFELCFHGNFLAAEFTAGCTREYEGIPGDETAPFHYSWPCAAVFIDDEEKPVQRLRVDTERKQVILFQADSEQTHVIRVVKLTENVKTFLALESLQAEGSILPLQDTPTAGSIEFIGDSITCGYGNETAERDRFYYDTEENGTLSHAYLAARMLGLECSMVSVSGICLGEREEIPIGIAMNEIFPYTDVPGQTRFGVTAEKWNFRNGAPDYAVLNLGTNDATAMSLSRDPDGVEEQFHTEYREFLYTMRTMYGPDTRIICALGSMDYYLYDAICRVVEEYCAETGDSRVSTFKYMRMCPMEPAGASGHPYLTTHRRMASDLTAYIRKLEADTDNKELERNRVL